MNIKSITYILGWILKIEALFMLLPIATAVVYGEAQGWAFVAACALSLGFGLFLTMRKPKKMVFYVREGFVTTALGWILMSMFG